MLSFPQISNVSCTKPSALHRKNSNRSPSSLISGSYRTICALIIASAVLAGVTGCGQKSQLYLVDTSSQTVMNSSELSGSTSNPQDAAFDNISDDPNDY